MNERTSLDRSLQRLEDDNSEFQRQVQQLQAQLAEAEQQHAQRYKKESCIVFVS